MAADALISALNLLKSDKIRQRSSGLNQIQYLLNQSLTVNSLTAREISRILEEIFALLKKERYGYISASNKDPFSERLLATADLLRQFVERACDRFRLKQVRIVLSGIFDALPISASHESHRNPLIDPLLKTLAVLAEYSPHVEHFSEDDWRSCVQFACRALEMFNKKSLVSEESQSIYGEFSSPRPSGVISSRILDLLKFLRILVTSSTVAIQHEFENVFPVIRNFLLNFKSSSTAHADALDCINTVLDYAVVHNVKFSYQVICQTFSVIPSLYFNSKSLRIKQLLSIFILKVYEPLKSLRDTDISRLGPNSEEMEALAVSISNLFDLFSTESLVQEYSGVIKQIRFNPLSAGLLDDPWLSLSCMSLRPTGNMTTWAMLHASYRIYHLHHLYQEPEESQIIHKKARISHDMSLASNEVSQGLDEIFISNMLDKLQTGGSNSVYYLIILSLHLQQKIEIPATLTESIIKTLLIVSNSNDSLICSWSLSAIGCYMCCCDAALEHSLVDQSWQVSCQLLQVKDNSTCACFVLSSIILKTWARSFGLKLKLNSLLELIIGSSGPALSTESLDLCLNIWSKLLTFNSDIDKTSDSIMLWLDSVLDLRTSNLFSYCTPLCVSNFIRKLYGSKEKLDIKPNFEGTEALHLLSMYSIRPCQNYLFSTRFHSEHRPDSIDSSNQSDTLTELTQHPTNNTIKNLISSLSNRLEAELILINISNFAKNPSMISTILGTCLICLIINSDSSEIRTVSKTLKKIRDLFDVDNLHDDYLQQFVDIAKMTVQSSQSDLMISCMVDVISLRFKDPENRELSSLLTKSRSVESLSTDKQVVLAQTRLELMLYADGPKAKDFDGFQSVFDKVSISEIAVSGQIWIPHCRIVITNKETSRVLLRLIAQRLLTDYKWERSEVVVLICVDLLREVVSHAISMNFPLSQEAHDVLGWTIRLLFEAGFHSLKAKMHICELFFMVLKCERSQNAVRILSRDSQFPPFGTSSLSCFIQLLTDSSNVVKYEAGKLLQLLFEIYAESQHILVYSELQHRLNLNAHNGSFEALAIQAAQLSIIPLKAQSLLNSVLFDVLKLYTPYSFDLLDKYIFSCFESLRICLGFDDTPSFFLQARSTLFYLWISGGYDILKFPYTRFGYSDFKIFLGSGNLEEIVSLIAGVNPDQVLDDKILAGLEVITQKSGKNLLTACFAKIVVYIFCLKPANFDVKVFLSRYLDGRTLHDLYQSQAVDIISYILGLVDFTTSDFETAILPILSIYPDDMKHLIDITIEKTGMTPTEFWDTGRVSYIMRSLLDLTAKNFDLAQRMNGIKRLKYLRSLSPHAFEAGGYVLEIFLRGIIPFTEIESCREEVFEEAFQVLDLGFDQLSLQRSSFMVEISLKYFEILFAMKGSHDRLKWLVSKFVLTPDLSSVHEALETILSWYSGDDINTNSVALSKLILDHRFNSSTKNTLLDIISLKLETETALESFLWVNSPQAEKITNVILSLSKDQNKSRSAGYTAWLSQLIGTVYLRDPSAEFMSKKLWVADVNIDAGTEVKSLNNEIKPISSIIGILVDMLDTAELESVGSVEACLRLLLKGLKPKFRDIFGRFVPDYILQFCSYAPSLEISLTMESMSSSESHRLRALILQMIVLTSNKIPALSCLKPVVNHFPAFSLKIFPYLVELLLVSTVTSGSNSGLDHMFGRSWHHYLSDERAVIKIIIETYMYLRSRQLTLDRGSTRYILVDLKSMSKSAIDIREFSSALMLIEMEWAFTDTIPPIMQKSLETIYCHIRDPDMYYSIPTKASMQGAVQTFRHANIHWNLLQYEAAVMNDATQSRHAIDIADSTSLIDSFFSVGLAGMSNMMLNSINLDMNENLRHDSYGYGWKLQQWDLPKPEVSQWSNEILYEMFYDLNRTNNPDQTIFRASAAALDSFLKDTTRSELIECLAIISETKDLLLRHHDHRELEIRADQQQETIKKWIADTRFEQFENLLIARKINWKSLVHSDTPGIKSVALSSLSECLYISGQSARKQEQIQKAMNASIELQNLLSNSEEQITSLGQCRVLSEVDSAESLWALGEQRTAIGILDSLMEKDKLSTLKNCPEVLAMLVS